MPVSMCKESSYAKVEQLGAQKCRRTRQGSKVMPCVEDACMLFSIVVSVLSLIYDFVVKYSTVVSVFSILFMILL